jgi:hypothetical protein
MRFIQSIKTRFFERSLRKKARARRRQGSSKGVNLETAKKIGLLFDATDINQRKAALDFVEQWSKRGKNFRLLGFFDSKLKDDNFTFPHFNQKDINWLDIPKGEAVEGFLSEDFDLLIHLAIHSNIQMEYISTLTNALLKVGPPSLHLPAYDLMIEVSESASIKQFIQQMEHFLQHINKSSSHA